MKIAFLVWRFPVVSEPFILNQITGLIDRGHEVDIYACVVDQDASDKTNKVHPAVEEYRLLERTYYAPKRPKNKLWRWLKAIGLLLANVYQINFYPSPLAYLQLINRGKLCYRAIPFLGRGSYDIIHCQFGTLGLVGLSLRQAGILQGKLITTFRGIDISRYVQEHGNQVYDQLFEEGDFFLANCQFFRQKALDLGCNPQKIIVHGSGIDCRKFIFKSRYFPADGLVRIVTTGRLVEKKGIEYCISAIAKLSQTYPNIQFQIIGDGPLKTDLERQIQALSISHLVKLLGWKNQREVIEILDNSHIFLAPSVTAADGNQDAPVNTLKEAMAMGLPVISTNHGGIPELVEDGVSGFLVPERDANSIANKLQYLLANPDIWLPMGSSGHHRVVQKYDRETLNDELVEIYQNLLLFQSTTEPNPNELKTRGQIDRSTHQTYQTNWWRFDPY
ncbi:MAG: colanic acid biosynthesis glycosyltransferase WcaL [Symploca sp. SIO2B6]|nr:colanic acid biosynthesis glycosyltransferase WcaL [Symploca sp. SIO2B6]